MRTVYAALLALSIVSGTEAAQPATVKVGVEGAFPPWNATTSDGKLVGLDIDLIGDLCRRAELTCNLSAGDWASLIPSLNAGKYDVVLSVGINDTRRKVVDFTAPYAQGAATSLVSKDGNVKDLPMTGQRLDLRDHATADPVMAQIGAALKGRTVGVVRSTSHEQLIHQYFGSNVEVRTYATSQERDADVRAGRVDVGFDSAVYAEATLDKPGNEDLQVTGPLMKGPPLATDVAIALRKDEPDLKARLDKAIEAAAADGTVRRLSVRWSKIDLTPGQ